MPVYRRLFRMPVPRFASPCIALAEKAYSKLIHYNKLDKRGHFAAWEQPKLISEELRTGFKSLRA